MIFITWIPEALPASMLHCSSTTLVWEISDLSVITVRVMAGCKYHSKHYMVCRVAAELHWKTLTCAFTTLMVFIPWINVTTLSSFPTLDYKLLTGWHSIKLALVVVREAEQTRKVCRICSWHIEKSRSWKVYFKVYLRQMEIYSVQTLWWEEVKKCLKIKMKMKKKTNKSTLTHVKTSLFFLVLPAITY